jgi:hypothetical protein
VPHDSHPVIDAIGPIHISRAEGDGGVGDAVFRGPLRYEIETSVPQLQAGTKFTVYVRITNPYDVPVTVLGVDTLLPVEFRNVKDRYRSGFARFKDAVVNRALSEVELPQVHSSAVISDEMHAEGAASILLQPGNSVLHGFNLETRKSVLFTPSVYNLQFQVRYVMAGRENHDTVKHHLNVRAPIHAMILGSAAGATVGAGLRLVQPGGSGEEAGALLANVATVLSSVLLGAVLVIAFARKREAQPFITIEDFWGGFFVGFVAGYQGTSGLKGLLSPAVTGG